MEKQKTLGKSAFISGIALHTGARANLKMNPAPANHGVSFIRSDVNGAAEVAALATNVVDVRRGTTISNGQSTVCTVEHVMAALHVAGIDNAIIEMDGPEPPICDGSALPFWNMVKEAEAVEQDAEAEYYTPSEPVIIEQGDTFIAMTPAESFKITCSVAFGSTPLDTQFHSCAVDPDSFDTALAGARTFVLFRELEQLIAMGLAKGGSLDCACILHDGAIISNDGQRFPNELVRHKIIDIIGDLYLIGKRVKAHVIAIKPGHPANVALAQKAIARQQQA